MTENLARRIQEVGLSANEAAVYLAALKLGPTTVMQLARSSEVKRTTVYSVLESLLAYGLMRIEPKGFKKRYTAEAPEKLDVLLEGRRSSLLDLLPELSAIYNLHGGESFLRYYQGLDSIKSIYEGLIKDVLPKEDYLVISDQSRWYNLDPEFFESFTRRRGKLNINIKLLLTDTPIARDFQKRQVNYNMTVKILPKNTILSTNLVVIPRRVVIHQIVPPAFAVVVENRSIVQMHVEMFKIIWDGIN